MNILSFGTVKRWFEDKRVSALIRCELYIYIYLVESAELTPPHLILGYSGSSDRRLRPWICSAILGCNTNHFSVKFLILDRRKRKI